MEIIELTPSEAELINGHKVSASSTLSCTRKLNNGNFFLHKSQVDAIPFAPVNDDDDDPEMVKIINGVDIGIKPVIEITTDDLEPYGPIV